MPYLAALSSSYWFYFDGSTLLVYAKYQAVNLMPWRRTKRAKSVIDGADGSLETVCFRSLSLFSFSFSFPFAVGRERGEGKNTGNELELLANIHIFYATCNRTTL